MSSNKSNKSDDEEEDYMSNDFLEKMQENFTLIFNNKIYL